MDRLYPIIRRVRRPLLPVDPAPQPEQVVPEPKVELPKQEKKSEGKGATVSKK